MKNKALIAVAISLALAGCQTTSNQPTDSFVKNTLEGNATTLSSSSTQSTTAQ